MGQLPDLGVDFDPAIQELIGMVTIVSYPDIWEPSVVDSARRALQKQYGRLPTLPDLAVRFGRPAVEEIARSILEFRERELKDAAERMGNAELCHLCGAGRRSDDKFYEFALAKDVKKHWGGAIAKLALNVVTVPLGVVIAARPTETATLARCRLMLCGRCTEARRGLLGGLRVTREDCRKHPAWDRLLGQGFDRFVDAENLTRFR